MSLEETIIGLLPAAFSTARELANLVSPKAAAGVDFSRDVVTFLVRAEKDGLSPELVAEKLDEMLVDFLKRLKFGL